MIALRAKERRGCIVSVNGAYRPRQPRTSPLWRCLVAHFDEFLALYPERYQARLGGLRPVIKCIKIQTPIAVVAFTRQRIKDMAHAVIERILKY